MTDIVEAPPRTRAKPVDPRLLRYARSSRSFFIVIAAIAFVHTAVIVAFAWFLTTAIVGAIEGMPLPELLPTLGALGAVVIVRALLLWAREAVASRAAARVQTELRSALVVAVGALGPEWLSTRNSAELALTAGRGLDALEAYFGRYLPQLVQTVVATPLIIAVMWWQDWISGLTVVLTIPLIPIFMVLIGLATRAVQERQWKTLQRLASRFSDTVQGLSTLKVFGRQHRAAASIERVTDDYRRETMRVLRVSFLSGFALEFLASIAVAIVAVSIGFRLIDGSLTLAVGLFVLLLAPEAYLPLRQVGVQFHAASEGVAATDDVFDVLDAARTRDTARASEPSARPRSETSRVPAATLVVRELRVVRGGQALPAVSFTAMPGTVTLIEGPSGAGKSSLLAALRGAATFDGVAEVDAVDVRTLAPASWLAWAGQQPGLVTGTIAANVALGDENPDAALVTHALSLACAADLPPSYELGVRGSGISGGQAQRVAVARSFYRYLSGRAAVVAVDEPSAALDATTENRLWQSIRSLADDGATVLLVSHRTTARDIADQVVRIEPSEVIA
ncbi:thiol reductant ABC exporter subunit CydD [Microbacterium sp. SLBN-146]|uniref:thiol reductant ABC exporter subunit CydD n=1 Tax=Microbacterium sp. SLBN-146 TaxID=2768457 RepID=UPI001152F003|nr:thiol reductant ABC exporter subunit CydD [Microbacterium sp. SLBN-146]TQJ31249.1 ATP-binding cassette subfamily C protein CydD [Microbacterium sp. SLBN-146]